MMPTEAQHRAACDILYKEARYLDMRTFDKWLALFHEDAQFWVPTWKDEGEPTSDTFAELSLIYCSSREQLRERAERAGGGRSIASLPPMRTAHTISNIVVTKRDTGALFVESVAASHVYNIKKRDQNVFFSLQEHVLEPADGRYCIRSKKLLLLNDYIPRMIDFYTI